MFDRIHLREEVFNSPQSDPLMLNKYAVSLSTSSSIRDDFDNFMSNCSFCNDGVAYAAVLHPEKDFTKSHLFYLQTFIYMNADSQYYTERSLTESFLLIYTYSGKGRLTYEGKTYSLTEGDGVFINCKIPHRYETDGKFWSHSILHFYGSYSDFFYNEITKNKAICFHYPVNGSYQVQLEKLMELYEDISPYRNVMVSNQLENLLMMLLIQSNYREKLSQKTPENLKYLIHYIENNYMKPLSLDYLSDFSNISKYYLCRLFNKYFGMSPKEYIIRLRLDNAKKMLKTTTFPANMIGAMVGFDNETYFYRLFKARTGVSPTQYRKQKT